MPMIDVYATTGTFADKHQLAVDLASTVMRVEQVPDIPMFRRTRRHSSMNSRRGTCRTSTARATTCGSRC